MPSTGQDAGIWTLPGLTYEVYVRLSLISKGEMEIIKIFKNRHDF